MRDDERNGFRRRAIERVQQRYSWDTVTADYERLFRQLVPPQVLAAGRRAGVDN
jgi:glycosyltransferase involved in cell wall biosynthesis